MKKALKFECLLCLRRVKKWKKGGDYIKIKAILKNKQPEDYKKLINFANEDKSDDELSFKDFEKMMKHDSYKRHKGAIRQVNHSWIFSILKGGGACCQ